jgi:hypothetical protein
MTNNMLTLDGMSFEKIVPTAAEKQVYQPSKNKMQTQAEIDRAGRPVLTRKDFETIGAPSLSIQGEDKGTLFDDADLGMRSMYYTNSKKPYGELQLMSESFVGYSGEFNIDINIEPNFDHIVNPFVSQDFIAGHVLGLSIDAVADLKRHIGDSDINSMYAYSTPEFDLSVIAEWSITDPIVTEDPTRFYTDLPEFDGLLNGFKRGGVTVIGGEAGAGASRLLKAIGKSIIDNGQTFIASMAETSIDNFARDVLQPTGQPGHCALLDNGNDVKSLVANIREAFDDCPEEVGGIDAVLIDRLGFYKDEGADFLMRELRKIATQYNIAIIATNELPHQSSFKNDLFWHSQDYSVISMADAALTIQRDGRSDNATIKIAKSRDYNDLSKTATFSTNHMSFTKFD